MFKKKMGTLNSENEKDEEEGLKDGDKTYVVRHENQNKANFSSQKGVDLNPLNRYKTVDESSSEQKIASKTAKIEQEMSNWTNIVKSQYNTGYVDDIDASLKKVTQNATKSTAPEDKQNSNNMSNKPNTGKQESLDLENLEKEFKRMESELMTTKTQLALKQNEFAALQEDFVKKIKQKADEAQAIIDQERKQLLSDSEKQISEIKKYALEKNAFRLLDVLANFEAANNAVNNASPEIKNFAIGYKMIYQSFLSALSSLSINEIEVKVGDKFDETIMEVVDEEKNSKFDPGCVVRVESKGYRLHERVIVPAKVILASEEPS